MKKDSPIRLLPGYISFSFPVQIGLYPGNKQAECQGAKKYPIIPIGISDFSKSDLHLGPGNSPTSGLSHFSKFFLTMSKIVLNLVCIQA